jgi:integrase/recombinase XerC
MADVLFTLALAMRSGLQLNSELAERYSRWLTIQRYSPITCRLYRNAVSRFCRFLGPTSALRCTPREIQNYLIHFAGQKPRDRALQGECYALRIFYDFLAMGNLVIWSPPRMVKLRTPRRHIPNVLTENQISRLMRAARNPQERAILEVIYGTGCRTGEILSMRVENVDFRARRIRVSGKTGTRFVHFTTQAAHALHKYIGNRRDGFLFVKNYGFQRIRPRRSACGAWRFRWKRYDPSGNGFVIADEYCGGRAARTYSEAVVYFSKFVDLKELRRPVGLKPLGTGTITKTVRKIGLRVGVQVTPYALRHSFATHLLDHGADVLSLKELMGHSRLESTMVYARVSKSRVRSILERCHPRSASRS